MSFPSVQYNVYYELFNKESSCFEAYETRCKVIHTYNNTVVIPELQEYSFYTIRISVKNYYSSETTSLGPPVEYRTKEGIPSAPVNVTATAVSPYRIDVTWRPPLKTNGPSVSYEVFWRVKGSAINTFSAVFSECGNFSSNEEFSMVIPTSEAGEEHHVFIRAYSSNCLMHSDSDEVTITAIPLPNNLTLQARSPTSILLAWNMSGSNVVSKYYLEYREVDESEWRANVNESTTSSGEILFEIDNLVPKARYYVRMTITYREKGVDIIWPRNSPFEFLTAGDIPSMPGKPELKLVDRDIYEIFWYGSINYGDRKILYELQQRSENTVHYSDIDNWNTVYNNSDTKWILDGISTNSNYEFRVRAYNEYGYSNYSYSEKPFTLPEAGASIDPAEDQIGIVIASCIVTALILFLLLSSSYILHKKKGQKNKKIIQDAVTANQLMPDLELATLQDLPLHPNFVHQTNALYNLSDVQSDEDFLNLPQVHRNQITFTKFLGSGAFGEVYEGIVCRLSEGTPSLNIAIKTLKKGATEHEKKEFLKEAKLMSNFKHEHILQLLGVCFEPNLIILELMEGGDLLTYLRSNRPPVYEGNDLTMDDLMSICIDVAEGCKYLEDMHFVHRDLAARNCLVSSYDRNERVVKIGDFGLARDIYKSDYYRKEGEALLPVRWMAPESLVYGEFTNYSDVWAFGVLLWEVITLGQQPYQARSNMEVLYYVRAGGRLDKPENCPDELYEIMVSCWSYEAEIRPTFFHCLNALKELRTRLDSSTIIMPAVYNFNYLCETNLGAYIGPNVYPENAENKLQDQQLDTRSTQSDPTDSSEMNELSTHLLQRSSSWSSALSELPGSSMSPVLRTPPTANKYLELLRDNEDADGYQLPRQFHRSFRNNSSCFEREKSKVGNSLVPHNFIDQNNIIDSINIATAGEHMGSLSSENTEESRDTSSDPIEQDLDDEAQEISSESESYPSCLEDSDNWSVSTASTATCHFDSSNQRNYVENKIPSTSCIDINYVSEASIC